VPTVLPPPVEPDTSAARLGTVRRVWPYAVGTFAGVVVGLLVAYALILLFAALLMGPVPTAGD
jgi:hypothetical protein